MFGLGIVVALIATYINREVLLSIVEQGRRIGQTKMRTLLLSAFSLWAAVLGQSNIVENYVRTQSPIAKAGVLANIGPGGVKSAGAWVS